MSKSKTMTKTRTFSDGFKEGYELIKGSEAAVPTIPNAPATQTWPTSYSEGVQAGLEAAFEV